MIQRLMLVLAAAAAVMAAAGVLVVALAFTLYAAMRDAVGLSPAGASAAVALAASLILLIPALVLAIKASARGREPTLLERLRAFVSDRPVSAAAAAAAAGLFAIRNPKSLIALLLALLDTGGRRR